jgi:hypothetical protein
MRMAGDLDGLILNQMSWIDRMGWGGGRGGGTPGGNNKCRVNTVQIQSTHAGSEDLNKLAQLVGGVVPCSTGNKDLKVKGRAMEIINM